MQTHSEAEAQKLPLARIARPSRANARVLPPGMLHADKKRAAAHELLRSTNLTNARAQHACKATAVTLSRSELGQVHQDARKEPAKKPVGAPSVRGHWSSLGSTCCLIRAGAPRVGSLMRQPCQMVRGIARGRWSSAALGRAGQSRAGSRVQTLLAAQALFSAAAVRRPTSLPTCSAGAGGCGHLLQVCSAMMQGSSVCAAPLRAGPHPSGRPIRPRRVATPRWHRRPCRGTPGASLGA